MPQGNLVNGFGQYIGGVVVDSMSDMKLHLFTPALSPTPATALSEFTTAEVAFSGYAALDIASWSAPINIDAVQAAIRSGENEFIRSALLPGVNGVAAGWYLTQGTPAAVLVMYGLFDSPVSFVNPGDGTAFTITWPWGDNQPSFINDQ